MAFLGQNPRRCKIVVDKQMLQVKNFRYLSCEIPYENNKDIKKTSNIFSNTGNSNQHF